MAVSEKALRTVNFYIISEKEKYFNFRRPKHMLYCNGWTLIVSNIRVRFLE